MQRAYALCRLNLWSETDMKKFFHEEKGAIMTVESTFVFPIMFFVLFFLIYFGNAYYVKSTVDNVVSRYAILAAAECADAQLSSVIEKGSVSTDLNSNKNPYRYLGSGYGESVAQDYEGKIKRKINDTGFFSGMQPVNVDCDVKYNGGILYQSVKASVNYSIRFPVRFIFDDNAVFLNLSAVEEVPVVDGGEFVLNTNMVIDYVERTNLPDKIKEIKENLSKSFNSW